MCQNMSNTEEQLGCLKQHKIIYLNQDYFSHIITETTAANQQQVNMVSAKTALFYEIP